MTSNGKIDIYAHDSVSIHSEHDFNFRADRDINLEAGRNIHVSAGKNMETNVSGYYYLTVDSNSKISVRGTQDYSVEGSAKFTSGGDYELLLGNNFMVSANGGLDLSGESHVSIGSAVNLNLGANGRILATGTRIDLNGPIAAAPKLATQAETPADLPLFLLPNRKFSAGWSNSNFYKADDIKSIMQRVPTHEPWEQHENINPAKFAPQATDITMADRSKSGVAPNPASAAGGAPNPQETANPPAVSAGTCTPEYAKEINARAAQTGIAALKKAAADMGLTSPYAVASLLGVAGGESRWETVEEKFGYSAARLLEVFPSVFKGDLALAQKYAGNPNNSLPEFLYGYNTAKGKGLGNTEPGDGGKFIGRGYIGLTGRSNYTNFSKWMYEAGKLPNPTALLDDPKLLNDSKVAAEVSVLYFLKLVKTPQTDAGYFEAAYRKVGFCTKDIYTRKKGYYECFLAQLQGSVVSSGSGGFVTDSSGTPIKTGF
jgi:predicted chitinase